MFNQFFSFDYKFNKLCLEFSIKTFQDKIEIFCDVTLEVSYKDLSFFFQMETPLIRVFNNFKNQILNNCIIEFTKEINDGEHTYRSSIFGVFRGRGLFWV